MYAILIFLLHWLLLTWKLYFWIAFKYELNLKIYPRLGVFVQLCYFCSRGISKLANSIRVKCGLLVLETSTVSLQKD